MLFMVYEEDHGLPGSFTKGRVYIAFGVARHEGGVDYSRVAVTDDTGARLTIRADEGSFRFLEAVYAAWVASGDERLRLRTGDVVMVTDASDDMLQVEGVGYVLADNLQLLDADVLRAGMVLLDRKDGVWRKVMRIDEAEWVTLEGSEDARPLTDFRFAVSGGEVATQPLVVCREANGDGLTQGAFYRLIQSTDSTVRVKDDEGKERWFAANRFSFD